MKRNILIFPDNIETATIENYITQSVEVGYELTIIKIVPIGYKGQVYAYTTSLDWLKTIFEKYNIIQKWHDTTYINHKILFNVELSINNAEIFMQLVKHYQLPLFVDYFYTNGDSISFSDIVKLKDSVNRIDFNHLYSDSTESMLDLNSIIRLFDNYDIYEDNILTSLSKEFILEYINSSQYKVVEGIEELSFKDLLSNFHSATPIFMLEHKGLSLYLFGFKRFYDMNAITENILSFDEFLQKTVIYLNKKMSKNFVCSDCEQRNNCFTQGLWLNHNRVESTEQCFIYPLLKKEL